MKKNGQQSKCDSSFVPDRLDNFNINMGASTYIRFLSGIIVLLLIVSCKRNIVIPMEVDTYQNDAVSTIYEEPLYFLDNRLLPHRLNFDSIDITQIAQVEVVKDSLEQVTAFGMFRKRGIVAIHTRAFMDSVAIAESDTLNLLFIGDIMGHDPQIASAKLSNGSYDYSSVFAPITPLVSAMDFTIANLEVTLAGPPFSGYPQFSSPDHLAQALKNAGIEVLMTANNHTCDKGKNGIIRTIAVLDSLGLKHTGSWKDTASHALSPVLILRKNDFKIGILNYTYGTNGLPAPPPTYVNLIDTARIAADIAYCDSLRLDEVIVFVHWGREYELIQSAAQADLAAFLFQKGINIVIGAHPHLVQPMQMVPGERERLVVYSLGNFVSDQRTSPRDGGALFELKLVKMGSKVHIADRGYHLTWVHKFLDANKMQYEVLLCSQEEASGYENLNAYSQQKMKEYIAVMREHLGKSNLGVPEILLDSTGQRISK